MNDIPTSEFYKICESGIDRDIISMLSSYALPVCMLKIILKRKDLKPETLEHARADKRDEIQRAKLEPEI